MHSVQVHFSVYNGVSDDEILEYAQIAAMASLRTPDTTSCIEEL